MPVLSEQQQNAPTDWGNVDKEGDAVRRHKPSGNMPNKKKKQARWSLVGTDMAGACRLAFEMKTPRTVLRRPLEIEAINTRVIQPTQSLATT